MSMAEHQEQGRQLGYQQQQHSNDAIKGYLPRSEQGPSSSQVLAVVTLFPVGAFLLLLAGLTLTGTLVGLAITTPLFLLFSPILVPAVLVIGLAVTGFVTSGAFGVTALSSFSWLVNFLRQSGTGEQLEHAKRWTQDTAGQLAQKTQDTAGQMAQKTQDTAGNVEQRTRDTAGDVGKRTKEADQNVQSKTRDVGSRGQGGRT
ncbi:Oleosin [Quillaja saponaria]|uniref:Oleosin n=1 Tax=Quillaja saponaria TaxID=32244 RepID=A0AAD7LE49_QUISA|nr:Oleosin [Quillaja saponaria]